MKTECGTIATALREQRFETARRLALRALSALPPGASDQDLRLLLHEAWVNLGDIQEAQKTVEDFNCRDEDERLRVTLLLAEDYHTLSSYDFYRGSAEAAQGLTGDEYAEKYEAMASRRFAP